MLRTRLASLLALVLLASVGGVEPTAAFAPREQLRITADSVSGPFTARIDVGRDESGRKTRVRLRDVVLGLQDSPLASDAVWTVSEDDPLHATLRALDGRTVQLVGELSREEISPSRARVKIVESRPLGGGSLDAPRPAHVSDPGRR